MTTVFIMRGVPGSGKSTLAKQLAGQDGVIHSTDSYFVKDGIYCFDPTKLSEYHAQNFKAFQQSVDNGVEVIVVDNVNSKHWHFIHYLEYAERKGCNVAIVSIPHPPARLAAERNTHAVPLYAIEKLIREWES